MSIRTYASIAVLLALAGCAPKETAGTGMEGGSAPLGATASAAMASASASASSSAVTAAQPPATAENDPLPAHSDAAKKVRADISKENYKTELDKIEKEIE